MNYPNKISIILPIFATSPAGDAKAYSDTYIYLRAYGLLTVTSTDDGGLEFHQDVQIDPVGSKSIELLTKLCYQIDADTTLAGWRLDDAIAGLIRVPRDSEHEGQAREPLMRLLLALSAEPIDVSWSSSANGIDLLDAIAADALLPAEWDMVPATANPVRLRQQLAGRTQSIWLAIANDRMSRGDSVSAKMALHLFNLGAAMV